MRNRCEYDNSIVQFLNDNGRLENYSRCNACGKWHKGQYGIELKYTVPNSDSWIRMKLCRKCAKMFENDIKTLVGKLLSIEPKEDTSAIGEKIKKVQEEIFGAVNKIGLEE